MITQENHEIADTLEMMIEEGHYKGGFMCINLGDVCRIDLIPGYKWI